jgi:hypothetical protein
MASACQVPTLIFFLSQGHPTPKWKCVHVNEKRVIVSKIVFYLAINISNNIDNFVFTLLCIEMAMDQCIIFHHALCHHASCYIININLMVHMYCVRKGEESFKMTIWIRYYHISHLRNKWLHMKTRHLAYI